MTRRPRQARSIASMERMLDAAESLFAAGGAQAVTVEAVVREAGTSVGAFYARFEDRAGLLVAMHDRFLDRMGAVAAAAVAASVQQSTLEGAVAEFVRLALAAVRTYRESILFFVAVSATDTPLRRQGLAANPGFAAAFAAVVMPHLLARGHAHPEQAADMAFRMLFALFVQRAMFTPREATGRAMSDRVYAAEIVRALVAYLERSATPDR